ncbi:unnamed protein product [Parajaminaea phylloscopi]
MTDSALDVLTLVVEAANSLDSLKFTDAEGQTATDLLSSAFIHFASAPDHPFPRTVRTRVLRSRNSPVLSQGSTSTPDQPDDEAHAEEFLPLDALVFLLQTRAEPVGLYAVKATRERVARVDTLDRPSLLDFLTGNKPDSTCEVVLTVQECEARRTRRAAAVDAAATDLPAASGVPAAELHIDASAEGATSSNAITASASRTLHPLLAAGKRPYAASKSDATFVKRLRASEVVLRDRVWAFRCMKTAHKKSANGTAMLEDSEEDDDDGDGAMSMSLDGASKGVLRSGSSKEVDFSSLRRSVIGKIAAAKSGSGGAPASSRPSNGPAQTSNGTSSLGRSAKHRRLDPIIILPSSPSSLLNLSNIKRLLEEGHFDAPSSANGGLAPLGGSNEVVVINRPKGGRFLAVDSLDALTRLGASRGAVAGSPDADPWKRVVCVITTGQEWQFRGYRWEEGRELFRHVFGAYARFSNQNKDENIKDWNVLDLQIDPSRRHHDAQLSAFFWRQLETWVQRKRPDLA